MPIIENIFKLMDDVHDLLEVKERYDSLREMARHPDATKVHVAAGCIDCGATAFIALQRIAERHSSNSQDDHACGECGTEVDLLQMKYQYVTTTDSTRQSGGA